MVSSSSLMTASFSFNNGKMTPRCLDEFFGLDFPFREIFKLPLFLLTPSLVLEHSFGVFILLFENSEGVCALKLLPKAIKEGTGAAKKCIEVCFLDTTWSDMLVGLNLKD